MGDNKLMEREAYKAVRKAFSVAPAQGSTQIKRDMLLQQLKNEFHIDDATQMNILEEVMEELARPNAGGEGDGNRAPKRPRPADAASKPKPTGARPPGEFPLPSHPSASARPKVRSSATSTAAAATAGAPVVFRTGASQAAHRAKAVAVDRFIGRRIRRRMGEKWVEAVVTDYHATLGHTLTFEYGLPGEERTELHDLYKPLAADLFISDEVVAVPTGSKLVPHGTFEMSIRTLPMETLQEALDQVESKRRRLRAEADVLDMVLGCMTPDEEERELHRHAVLVEERAVALRAELELVARQVEEEEVQAAAQAAEEAAATAAAVAAVAATLPPPAVSPSVKQDEGLKQEEMAT